MNNSLAWTLVFSFDGTGSEPKHAVDLKQAVLSDSASTACALTGAADPISAMPRHGVKGKMLVAELTGGRKLSNWPGLPEYLVMVISVLTCPALPFRLALIRAMVYFMHKTILCFCIDDHVEEPNN